MNKSIFIILIVLISTIHIGLIPTCFAKFTPQLTRQDSNQCAVHIYQHERLKNMPRHLLAAISKVESGRFNPKTKQVVAWPWTINFNGEGRHFASKNEAVLHVKNLIAQGATSIDIGCMQINLRHHPDAFEDIESAFDPRTNIEYAAQLLTKLKTSLGTWTKAVAHYHSANAQYHIPYRKKVYETWIKERNNPDMLAQAITETAYGDYMGSYGSRGKIYRNVSLSELRMARQNNSQWRMHEARYHLAQYREKATRALEQYERLKHPQTAQRTQIKNRKHVVHAKNNTIPAHKDYASKPVIMRGQYPKKVMQQASTMKTSQSMPMPLTARNKSQTETKMAAAREDVFRMASPHRKN